MFFQVRMGKEEMGTKQTALQKGFTRQWSWEIQCSWKDLERIFKGERQDIMFVFWWEGWNREIQCPE